MRLNLVYFKGKRHARVAQKEDKVPFKELRPLVLKNYISSTTNKSLENKCLFEMSLLFVCWKENQFKDSACVQQIQNLNTCYKNCMKNLIEESNLKKIEIPSPTAKTFTSKQINYMLRMYPTV